MKTDCRVTGEAADVPSFDLLEDDEPWSLPLFAADEAAAAEDLVAEPAALDAPVEALAEEVADLVAPERSTAVVLVMPMEEIMSDWPFREFLY